MGILDTTHYEEYYYTHSVADVYEAGEQHSTLEDALETARDDAVSNGTNMEITHVVARTIKRVIVETHVEDL